MTSAWYSVSSSSLPDPSIPEMVLYRTATPSSSISPSCGMYSGRILWNSFWNRNFCLTGQDTWIWRTLHLKRFSVVLMIYRINALMISLRGRNVRLPSLSVISSSLSGSLIHRFMS